MRVEPQEAAMAHFIKRALFTVAVVFAIASLFAVSVTIINSFSSPPERRVSVKIFPIHTGHVLTVDEVQPGPVIVTVLAGLIVTGILLKRSRAALDSRTRTTLFMYSLLPAALTLICLVGYIMYRVNKMTPPELRPVSRPDSPANPTHKLVISVGKLPGEVRANDSFSFECYTELKRLTAPFDPGATSVLLSLIPSHKYAASLDVESLGFEVRSLGADQRRPKPLVEGKRVAWYWLFAPKKEEESSTQLAFIDVALDDLADNKRLFNSQPVERISVQVQSGLFGARLEFALLSACGTFFTLFCSKLFDWYVESRRSGR